MKASGLCVTWGEQAGVPSTVGLVEKAVRPVKGRCLPYSSLHPHPSPPPPRSPILWRGGPGQQFRETLSS